MRKGKKETQHVMAVRSHHILLDKSNKQRTEILVSLSKCPDFFYLLPSKTLPSRSGKKESSGAASAIEFIFL